MRTHDGWTWAMVDQLYFLVVAFAALCVFVSVQHVKAADKAAGQLRFTLHWPLAIDADVDLWVLSPDDPTPVGFINTHGIHCDLTRDDRGHKFARDPADSTNEEDVFCRVAKAGEYVVNAMLYTSNDGHVPVPATVTVTSSHNLGAPLLTCSGSMVAAFDEETLCRFTLDDKGDLVPGSVNKLPMRLYHR